MNASEAYCHVVAGLLASDGKMDDAERDFLEETMERLGLSDDEADRVRHFEGASEAEAVVSEMPAERKKKLRDDLLGATLADGSIDEREQKIMERLSEKLQL